MTDAAAPSPGRWLHWLGWATAVIGLASAVLALVTTFQDHQAKIAEQRREIETLRLASDEKSRQLEEARRHEVCAAHLSTVQGYEDSFAELARNNGTLLAFLRQCRGQASKDGRDKCFTLVCGGAYVLSGGESNCVGVLGQLSTIRDNISIARGALAQDRCPLPASPAIEAIDTY